MIVDQRYVDYINSLEKELLPYLEELEQYALQTEVPIIRKEMQSFLKTLLKMNKPKQILEVGTAIGFSALLMKEFMEGSRFWKEMPWKFWQDLPEATT